MNVQEVSLDISLKRNISPEVYIGQDDSNATTLVASIFDGATPFNLGSYTVRFCMRLPDGVHYYSVAGTTSGNVATFDIDETYAGAVHGTTDVAYVEISDGEDLVASTSRMCVIVLRGAQAGATPGEAYISEIEEAVERLDEVVEAAQEVLDDGIPLMSPTRRGGAKLGQGLKVDSDTLSLGNLVQSGSGAEVATDGCAIYSVDGEGWATQDGTPTPDAPVEIEVARGRNVLDESTCRLADGWYIDTSTNVEYKDNNNPRVSYIIAVERNQDYTFSCTGGNVLRIAGVPSATPANNTAITTIHSQEATMPASYTFNSGSNDYVFIYTSNSKITAPVSNVQLELGSTPSPYVPYGCVGLEVRENGTLKSCTPIPLPAKGFAASLPDGTADALTVDSAGRWEWVSASNEVVLDGSESWGMSSNAFYVGNWTVANNARRAGLGYVTHARLVSAANSNGTFFIGNDLNAYILSVASSAADFKTWLTSNHVTVLYPLATPTTEHGYIDLPDLPEGATVSIPELKQIGVSWFVPGVREIAQHAANWGHRAQEQESRIAALEAAVAELATA